MSNKKSSLNFKTKLVLNKLDDRYVQNVYLIWLTEHYSW